MWNSVDILLGLGEGNAKNYPERKSSQPKQNKKGWPGNRFWQINIKGIGLQKLSLFQKKGVGETNILQQIL